VNRRLRRSRVRATYAVSLAIRPRRCCQRQFFAELLSKLRPTTPNDRMRE